MSTQFDAPETDQPGVGLRHYSDVIRRRKWILLAVLATSIGVAVALSVLVAPKYKATTKVVVGQGSTLFPPNVANAVQPFTATMADLVQSNVLANRVIENLGLETRPDDLLEQVTVSINPETAVLKIDVVDTDRERARLIAAEMATVFSQLIDEQFGDPVQTAPGEAPQPPITAKIWDPAHVERGQVSPRPVRNVAIATVLGLILGLLAAFLRDHFDRSLRTREGVEQSFGVPVIGQIPTYKSRKRARAMHREDFGEVAEAFRAVRANLQYLAVKRPLRTILITSASPEQGKTTVTANLAVAIARSGATTIAVESDLRRPRLDDALGLRQEGPGLTSLLVGAAEFEDVVVDVPLPAGAPNGPTAQTANQVAFIPSGPLPPNPSELLSSFQMRELLDRLANQYDYVLVDSPPVLLVADALELARMVDGVVVVVRRNRSSTDEARELRALVERLDINLVGVVFTDTEPVGAYGTYAEDPPPARQRASRETRKQKGETERATPAAGSGRRR